MNKEDLKIVFLGTPDFAVESLDRLVTEGYNVTGVVTMPDKPAGRGHKMYQSPVKEYALAHGLRLMQPVNLKDPAFIDELRSIGADLFIVIAFRMLPEAVWSMPALGTFNLHASLLPRYRGAAPINRAVMNGDTETGVTTFMLKHEIDTGDVLRQEKIDIAPDEDAGSVHDRLMTLGADLTLATVADIVAGTLRPVSQDELIADREPTPAPKIFAEDMAIDWRRPAAEVYNHIRGLAPYPAARAVLRQADGGETPVSVFKAAQIDFPGLQPGQIGGLSDHRLIVGCGDGCAIELLDIRPAGKKRMIASDYLRGARLNAPFFAV